MKRRKTQQTIRAERAGHRKRMSEQNSWTIIHDADVAMHWGTFAGGATFTTTSEFREGDVITISNADTSISFGIDLAYKPVNPKRIHPARRRKAIRKEKGLMNNQITLTSGGSSVMCEKISNTEWKVMGDII